MLTRPSSAEVAAYRAHVDAAMAALMRDPPPDVPFDLIELGLQHEEQHQELLVTDALHALAQNPLCPAFDPAWREPDTMPGPARFLDGPTGVVEIGQDSDDGRASPSTTRPRGTASSLRPSASPTGW